MSRKNDDSRLRTDMRNASMKKTSKGFAISSFKGGSDKSVFASFSLPSGKIKIIDKDVFEDALSKSDEVIRSNSKIKLSDKARLQNG